MTQPVPAPEVDVSVVLPCYDSATTLAQCLDALREQSYSSFEVIVVDGSPDAGPTAAICDDRPEVRYLRADPSLGAHAKRNMGVDLARGRILAFTDPDCVADPGWLSALVTAHAASHPVVGGPVAGLPDWRNRAIHICKYAWWLPGTRSGQHLEIPSANTSVTRPAWEAGGPFREDRWAGDSELSWRLRRQGLPIWFDTDAQVTHLDHGPWLPFLKTRVERGFDFGRTRIEFRRWGVPMRSLRVLLSPLTPLVMTLRAAPFAFRAGQGGRWLWSLPLQVLAHSCWAAGEAAALIGGTR